MRAERESKLSVFTEIPSGSAGVDSKARLTKHSTFELIDIYLGIKFRNIKSHLLYFEEPRKLC